MKFFYKTLFFCTVVSRGVSGYAHTQMEHQYTCPIGGETFKQTMASSGTSYGAMLDFKPYGPIAAPWPLAVCPSNGFVMYKHDFTEQELALLQPLIEEASYRSASPHYRAYRMMKAINAPIKQQFNMLLGSTWRGTNEYRQEALGVVQLLLLDSAISMKERINFSLLKIEFERRLGLFDQSMQTLTEFEVMKTDPEVIPVLIIACQRDLISKKNASPSPIPNERIKCGDFAPLSM